MGRFSALVSLALGVALAAPASAQAQGQPPGKANTPNKEGEYQGVRPGKSEHKPRRSKRPTLTWVGFQARADGTTRLFLQLNRDAEIEQNLDDKGVLHVTVVAVRYGSRNARRRLDTRFFDTALATVSSRRARRSRARKGRPAQKAGVRLDIRFKSGEDAAQAQISAQKEADGYHYVYLDFPAAKVRPEKPDAIDEVSTGDDVAP